VRAAIHQYGDLAGISVATAIREAAVKRKNGKEFPSYVQLGFPAIIAWFQLVDLPDVKALGPAYFGFSATRLGNA
jgi:hypothetical protein